MDVEAGDEMEMDIEGPEGDLEMEMGAEEEEEMPFQEGLYEAALQGLNIDLVDDKAQRRKALVQEVKKRIYERVVNRLIKESRSPQKRRPQRRRRKK
jgi:DnaJ-domain-containing protein 1